MLDWFFYFFPQFLPNHEVDEHNPHHRDRDSLVEADFRLKFHEIVEKYDYLFEEHKVTTDDGYILTLFRINHKEAPKGAPVVFLQHAVLDSADSWIVNHSEESPAFVFANERYDVWLGNFRGSRHSRAHVSLDPDSKDFYTRSKFFDFTWEEMARFDLPKMIGYALEQSNQD